jgi:hypothetical protein
VNTRDTGGATNKENLKEAKKKRTQEQMEQKKTPPNLTWFPQPDGKFLFIKLTSPTDTSLPPAVYPQIPEFTLRIKSQKLATTGGGGHYFFLIILKTGKVNEAFTPTWHKGTLLPGKHIPDGGCFFCTDSSY